MFGADGETIRGVFHVAAGDDLAGGQKKRGAYTEVAVRRVSVVRDSQGLMLQIGNLGWAELGMSGFRHDMSEAIGCGVGWQLLLVPR